MAVRMKWRMRGSVNKMVDAWPREQNGRRAAVQGNAMAPDLHGKLASFRVCLEAEIIVGE